ncbi:MAG: hypothetical protein U0836_07415 [Pirellulales bacterium]
MPDRDGDDRPDGPAEVRLTGWSLDSQHNIVSGLIWGPDGWLYGCHGILHDSVVGTPETPEAEHAIQLRGLALSSHAARSKSSPRARRILGGSISMPAGRRSSPTA